MSVSTSISAANPTPAAGAIATFAPWSHALLRIGTGLLYMQHGVQKLFGWFGGVDGSGGTVTLVSQIGLAGVLETFGGLLLVLGLLTRPVALLLAVEMLVAFLQVHLPKGGVPLQNGGEVPLLFMLVFLFLLGHGAGPASLDARRRMP